MEDPLTLDQLIKAVLDGGATLGMLLLFGFVILKLPVLMQEAIAKAIAPAVESTRALGQEIQHMQQELERLGTLILLQQQQNGEAKRHGPAIDTELQARLLELSRRASPAATRTDEPGQASRPGGENGAGGERKSGSSAGASPSKTEVA